MKQMDFFENFFTSDFGEIMFHFWYNNIKIESFWCQSNLDTVSGVHSISLLCFCVHSRWRPIIVYTFDIVMYRPDARQRACEDIPTTHYSTQQ
jgi:hypothetical protein